MSDHELVIEWLATPVHVPFWARPIVIVPANEADQP